jgi:2-polyprenyl-6-methoxyphenol hydroxylase-like FAD-dependent oxidoreductase
MAERVGELPGWDAVKLLTVRVDRLREWYRPGLLCIGDAAHAISPVGGVGINLAIQDGIAAANLLGGVTNIKPLLFVRLLALVPLLRRIPARLIGVGTRPEHIKG